MGGKEWYEFRFHTGINGSCVFASIVTHCVTVKTITIRELHAKTGEWVRKAAAHGEIFVSDHGETIARIVPERKMKDLPYFAKRNLSPAFQRLSTAGKLRGGPDVTRIISDDREDRDL
jgi:prevent-host-death family protein